MGLRLVSGSQNEREEDPNAKKGIMRREQRTGWIPREGTVRHSVDVQGRPFALRINSTGQRGPELEGRQPRKRRLLFLGDSFTMASQTREEDTFTARIDSLLNATTGVPVEVINSGVEGYSTYQELAYYRYYGRVFQPDIVVLCFFAGNDFRDNMVHTRQGQLLNPVLLSQTEKYRNRHRDPYLRRTDGALLYEPLEQLMVPQPHSSIAVWLERNLLLVPCSTRGSSDCGDA